jgi:hypothetical protein
VGNRDHELLLWAQICLDEPRPFDVSEWRWKLSSTCSLTSFWAMFRFFRATSNLARLSLFSSFRP